LNAQRGSASQAIYSAEFAGGTYAKAGPVLADAVRRFNEADTTEAFYRCQKIAVAYGIDAPVE
jgi:hypothetical protein